jgi:alkylated DNA repair dioxygenase AlkB
METSFEWLINDIERDCYCFIVRNSVSFKTTKVLFSECQRDCVKQYPIVMFGNTIMQPKLSCVYSDDNIKGQSYSGTTIPSIPWTINIKKLRDYISEVSKTFNAGFIPNAALINGYVTSDHYVGFHQDKNLKDGRNMVVTVSLGGSRTFKFREKLDKSKEFSTVLNNGDIVELIAYMNIVF